MPKKPKSVNYNHVKAALDRAPKTTYSKLCKMFPDVAGISLLAWQARWCKEMELTTGLDADGRPV
jgi:hypothetical protein